MSKNVQFHILNTLSQALSEVFEKSKHADRMIDKYSRANKNWTPLEKSFFAEATYEIIRNKRLLEFLSETPDLSTDLWVLIGTYLTLKDYKHPNRIEFSDIDSEKIKSRLKIQRPLAIEHSVPDWLFELGEKQFLNQWPLILKSLNTPPQIYLRTNTLKTNINQLTLDLKSEKIEVQKIKMSVGESTETLVLKERKNVFATQAFRNGHFEMQDAGSQMIAPLLQAQPGQKIVDTCSGSGGKSLHLAALMKNQGEILCMDIHDWKLNDLKLRASKAGISIIKTQLINSNKIIKSLQSQFDRVLIDSPCSGLGVLRRNPDTKWKLRPTDIDSVCQLQKQLLTDYSEMCKPQGLMVYATCSLLTSENEEQIRWFLNTKAGQKWSLQQEILIWPHKQDSDGFYAAVLKRNT